MSSKPKPLIVLGERSMLVGSGHVGSIIESGPQVIMTGAGLFECDIERFEGDLLSCHLTNCNLYGFKGRAYSCTFVNCQMPTDWVTSGNFINALVDFGLSTPSVI